MRRQLKILHLTGSLTIGGAERLILGLAEWTSRADFEVHVCAFGVFREESFLPDFKALDIPLYLIPINRFYDPRIFLAIVRYVRHHQIDVLHTHLTDADIMGRLVGRLVGIPVISTLQNHPQNYDSQRIDRRWLARVTACHFTTHLVAVSHHIRKLFITNWQIPEGRISTIYNAVALDNLLPIPEKTESSTIDSNLTVTNIASLTPQKAQHLLLEAAKIVLTRHPDTRFMIVGRGVLEQPLKEKARALGIADRVTFTGVRRDIPQLLAQSDIFVLSSLWEGLPLAAIEAMAAARPVVLTDVGGNYELVEPGTHGLIVPPGDVPALADGLLSLINDQPRRLAMGRAARKQVLHHFSIETVAKQYEALYQATWCNYHGPVPETSLAV